MRGEWESSIDLSKTFQTVHLPQLRVSRAGLHMIPLDRLLIETDAPYLSPHPKRGHRPNEPALVTHTASCLAELHGVSTEELGRITTNNAVQLFGIEDRLQIS